jgi:hypothetical protein
LLEQQLCAHLEEASFNVLDYKQAQAQLAALVPVYEDDRATVHWLTEHTAEIQAIVDQTRHKFALERVQSLLSGLSATDRKHVLDKLQEATTV